jgi:hypothetical protein
VGGMRRRHLVCLCICAVNEMTMCTVHGERERRVPTATASFATAADAENASHASTNSKYINDIVNAITATLPWLNVNCVRLPVLCNDKPVPLLLEHLLARDIPQPLALAFPLPAGLCSAASRRPWPLAGLLGSSPD